MASFARTNAYQMCFTGSSPAITESEKSDPTFNIVQAKSKRIVMILDVSGSMGTESNGVSRRVCYEMYREELKLFLSCCKSTFKVIPAPLITGKIKRN